MREAAFIRQNSPKWQKFERMLSDPQQSPDALADLFVRITNDLAYAKTYYAGGSTAVYLNQLAGKVHQRIYRNKKESSKRMFTFWITELPLLMHEVRPQLLYAAVMFAVAVVIGIVSAAHDPDFVRLILGDSYVNMTIQNISNNDPMAVYKSMKQSDMFMYISINNIRVSYMIYAFGSLFSLGSVYMLFQNGVMLGSFQYFFHEYGLLLESFLVIWIHGTLEISAIVIAGAAGLIFGNGILFARTYPRLTSTMKGAKDGLKIVIGLTPIFLVAAFLEGFVTRLTDMHDVLKILIIAISALFIVGYFVLYPIYLKKKL